MLCAIVLPLKEPLADWVLWFLIKTLIPYTLTHQGWGERCLASMPGRVNNSDNDCKQYQVAVAIIPIHKLDIIKCTLTGYLKPGSRGKVHTSLTLTNREALNREYIHSRGLKVTVTGPPYPHHTGWWYPISGWHWGPNCTEALLNRIFVTSNRKGSNPKNKSLGTQNQDGADSLRGK